MSTEKSDEDFKAVRSIRPSEMHQITKNLVHRRKREFKKQMKENMQARETLQQVKQLKAQKRPRRAFLTAVNLSERVRAPKKLRHKVRRQTKKQELKFSPLLEQYMKNRKFINKNCAPGFKIKLTPYFSELLEIEKKNKIFDQKFNDAMKIANYYDNKLKSNTLNKNLNKEINKIKHQALDNSKRLHKRKIEETKNGAHEYANYILSILNSDLNV